jgi:protocatechuate 3,4-dioxygenase alpha subunit
VTRLGETPSQTVGPFFAIALRRADVVDEGITVSGRVLDGAGEPVSDALVETWQADSDRRGFGRCPTDDDGRWAIVTRKPASVDDQAPHLAVSLFARGLLDRVVTRIYFGDEPDANASDPVLGSLPDDPARATLIAAPVDGGYALDLHLQGERETVFFDLSP